MSLVLRGRSALLLVTALGLVTSSGCAIWTASIPAGRTVSYGSTSDGFLVHGVAMPNRGRGYVRARPEDDTRYGTPQLVAALEHAASAVSDRHPDTSPLRIGDLSAHDGGHHFRHRSHRTGRDVDVLFYVADGRRSISASGFRRFDDAGHPAAEATADANEGASAPVASVPPSGRTRPRHFPAPTTGVHFDVARNWTFVQALLEDPNIEVQWIFVFEPLKRLLLDQAVRSGANPETILRASYVLHQPRGAAPHDDHFHIRVACSLDDLSLGCTQVTPLWPWMRKALEKAPVLASETDDELVAELTGDELSAELIPYALAQSTPDAPMSTTADAISAADADADTFADGPEELAGMSFAVPELTEADLP